MTDAPGGQRPRESLRSVISKRVRRSALIFVALLVVEYFVIPELIGASKNVALLKHVNIVWLVVAVIAEAASLLAYALLTRTLLPRGGPNLSTLYRIDLATTAVAHVVPAGTAGSAGLGYRLLTTHGVEGADAGFAMATQGLGSAVVLNVLLWFALVVSIPLAGFHWTYVIVAMVGMLAILAVAALVYAFTRGEESAARIVRAVGRKLPRVGEDRLERVVRHIGGSLRDLAQHRELLRRAVLWAAVNWLLDAGSLWCFVAAFGRYVDPVELFAAYGIANVLAVIPLTPGGLGLVDASAPAMLVSFGLTKNIALVAVIGWRLVNFWLPIPVGAACYLSLRLPKGTSLRDKERALRDLASSARHERALRTPSESSDPGIPSTSQSPD